MNWIKALQEAQNTCEASVLVSIIKVEGSAPRSVGARMVVSKSLQADTIGGGSLEHQAIKHARQLLNADSTTARIESLSYSLGKALSQCCGGRVSLQYDVIPASPVSVVVFGAGHVAKAIATLAAQLPWHTRFVDSRQPWLDAIDAIRSQEGTVQTQLLNSNTFMAVEQCPDNAHYLVVTHDHALDYELVEAILTRGDSRYCGLIASKSKATSFKNRLLRKGFTDSELLQLTAPIGESITTGNLPMEIAVAAVTDIFKCRKAAQVSADEQPATISFPSTVIKGSPI